MTDHPNTLVGLTTARIHFQEINNTGLPTTSPRINIEKETSVTGEDSRFILVLDALASLAVLDKSSQVIAISVQRKDELLEFRIAENKAVNRKVIEHVSTLLNLLNGIATCDQAERQAKELEFIKTTYLHSINKLHKRFTGYLWLEEFERLFAARETGENAEKCLGVVSSLITIRKALDEIKSDSDKKARNPNQYKRLYPTKAVKDEAWADLIFEMDVGVADVETLLNDRTLCDNWAQGLQGTTPPPSQPPPLPSIWYIGLIN